MARFYFALALCAIGLGAVLVIGDLPARRYAYSDCLHEVSYGYSGHEAALLIAGGSRIREATTSLDFETYVDLDNRVNGSIVNLSHSIFSIGKEYVLVRDYLQRNSANITLIQIRPNLVPKERPRGDFEEIARLSDIPLAWRAQESSGLAAQFSHVKQIVLSHFSISEEVDPAAVNIQNGNCVWRQYPFAHAAMLYGVEQYGELGDQQLEWDIDQSLSKELGIWVNVFKELEDRYDTQVIFLLMTASNEPLPHPNFSDEFYERTGIHLITLPPDLHAQLITEGKRDLTHLVPEGREIFLPWLVKEIRERCLDSSQCL